MTKSMTRDELSAIVQRIAKAVETYTLVALDALDNPDFTPQFTLIFWNLLESEAVSISTSSEAEMRQRLVDFLAKANSTKQ